MIVSLVSSTLWFTAPLIIFFLGNCLAREAGFHHLFSVPTTQLTVHGWCFPLDWFLLVIFDNSLFFCRPHWTSLCCVEMSVLNVKLPVRYRTKKQKDLNKKPIQNSFTAQSNQKKKSSSLPLLFFPSFLSLLPPSRSCTVPMHILLLLLDDYYLLH